MSRLKRHAGPFQIGREPMAGTSNSRQHRRCPLGDHGRELGEHGMWRKHTHFELDAQAPMIFGVPCQEAPGRKCPTLTGLVDIYPSHCDACGLAKPDYLESTSFAPLLDRPDRPWKSAAFSQYPRGRVMGYPMRTDRYRFTRWQNGDGLPETAAPVEKLAVQLQAGCKAARPA